MNILSLDIATNTGFAHSNGESGVKCWELKRGDSPGMRFLYFKSWLDDFCIFNKCDLFVYEQAAHHKSNAATHVCHGLIATAEQVAAHRRIEITSKSPSELKKYATGKGNANKDLMLAAARKRWPDLELVDDNHADALHLLSMMISDLNLKNKFDVMYGY